MQHGRHLVDSRQRALDLPAEQAFAPIRRIGGANGWYAYDALWWLRGALDLLVGGVGLRRGRSRPERRSPVSWSFTQRERFQIRSPR